MMSLKVDRRGMAMRVAACVIAALLAGCGTAPEPTFSPSEAATRLAAIPTAANVSPNAAPTNGATATEPTANLPTPTQAATAVPTAMPVEGNFARYTVKAGDTLSTIAFNFKISMAAIQLANQLGDSQVVQVGQALKIPQTKMFPDENILWVVVIVQPGDTLGAICQRYGTNLDDTVRVNQLGSASDIRAGQELIMPIQAAATYGGAETADKVDDSQAVAEVLVPETDPQVPAKPVAFVTVAAVAAEVIPTEIPTAIPDPVENAVEVEAVAVDDIVPIVPIVAVAPVEPTIIPEVQPATPIPAAPIEPLVPAAPANEVVVEAQKQLPAAVAADANTASMSAINADPFGAGNVEFMRAQILVYYNQARAAQGLRPLNLSFTLQQAAQLHAEDCAARGYGSHVGSDGFNSLMRMQRAGYYGKYTGENWAWGRTAEEAFDMWFTQEYPSGPHRDNILGANYTDVGFGIVASQGGYYFIADLGAS